MKIFVTVGSQKQQFKRLMKEIDIIASKHEIVVQIGHTSFSFKNKVFSFDFASDLEKYIRDADLIICHAGVGTIMESLLLNKKVICVPRFKIFKEHVNDHQVEIARKFDTEKYLINCEKPETLESLIKNIGNIKLRKYESNTTSFNLALRYEINSIKS